MTLVTLETNVGDIELELYDDKAPITVENFKAHAKSGYYDNTLFHKVMSGFLIQGGQISSDLNTKSSGTSPIQNEADNGLSNDRGTIAMARTTDPQSAISSFLSISKIT